MLLFLLCKSCFPLSVWQIRREQTARFHGNWVEGHSEGPHGCAGSNCTVPAQGTELWKTSGGGENAPGWVNPDHPLFLYSIGAVCFCFSQQAESHRKSRQPDQETTEADSFHLSWFRTVILHLSALITGRFDRLQIKVSVVQRMTQHLFWFL